MNWVENTGGSWDFSQQQEILMRKAIEHGIKVNKVYAANTSKENPFTTKSKRLLGEADKKTRKVSFKGKKYEIDRDILGAINIALRRRSKNKIESAAVDVNTDKDKNDKDKNEIDVTTKNKQARTRAKPKQKQKHTLIFNQRKLKNLIKHHIKA